MDPKVSNKLNRETEDAVYFFTPAFYRLDNFSAHSVRIWGKKFQTVEQAYQWKKFSSAEPIIAKKIFRAESPFEAKRIADENKDKIPPAWFEKGGRVKAMEELLRAKAEQHEDVRRKLKETGNRQIVENSPTDNFWGIGPKRNGKNTVGKIWMKVRKEYFKKINK